MQQELPGPSEGSWPTHPGLRRRFSMSTVGGAPRQSDSAPAGVSAPRHIAADTDRPLMPQTQTVVRRTLNVDVIGVMSRALTADE